MHWDPPRIQSDCIGGDPHKVPSQSRDQDDKARARRRGSAVDCIAGMGDDDHGYYHVQAPMATHPVGRYQDDIDGTCLSASGIEGEVVASGLSGAVIGTTGVSTTNNDKTRSVGIINDKRNEPRPRRLHPLPFTKVSQK